MIREKGSHEVGPNHVDATNDHNPVAGNPVRIPLHEKGKRDSLDPDPSLQVEPRKDPEEG